jgi:hypothetical protein
MLLNIYYRDAVPILHQRWTQPGLVQCFFSQGTVLLLEDLGQHGYKSVVPDMKHMMEGTDAISLSHAKLAVRRIAQMHAASFGTDWLQFFPQIKIDAIYDTILAEVSRKIQLYF